MDKEFNQQAEHKIVVKELVEIHPGTLDTKLFSKNSWNFIMDESRI